MQTLPEKLYTAEQVREMDRIAIEEHGIAGIALMRKAGSAVFKLLQTLVRDKMVIIFCGAGNNAGDGYVIARLVLEAGMKLRLVYLSKPEKLIGDAQTAYQDFVKAGGSAYPFDSNLSCENGVIIDALLGTGLNREVGGRYAEAISLINQANVPVIAVDIPSGINADTGMVMGQAVKADFTVSFIGLKRGLFTAEAAEYCGSIRYASLDVNLDWYGHIKNQASLIQPFQLPKRHRCAHKGRYGHVLLIGGDYGFSGAIMLAAEAALRIGAGLVSVATRKGHASNINCNRPEVMSHGVETMEQLSPLLEKASVVVIGPGLGKSQWAQNLMEEVVQLDKPLVCDADALNLLAKDPVCRQNRVLTPHPGEAARLLECSTRDIATDRFLAVTALQKKYGGAVLLKGAGTLVTAGEDISVSTTGNPGMASGGMGDTLTGMIAGLIAQGLPLYNATTASVFWHGKAADLAAQKSGEVGLLASDLMPYIRKLVNE